MAESNGHLCPECGAPRGTDNTPSCGCTQRASDALRDARTAEAAAAEDFDPLRIRPYVELEGEASAGAADVTMPLRAVPGPAPTTRDLSLFEGAGREGEDADVDGLTDFDDFDDDPRRRPRRTVLLGAAGGLVGVIAAAGLASGLFSYDTPTRNGALPEEVRASVPDAPPTTGAASQSPTTTAPRPTTTPPSASTSPSPPPSPSPTSASPTPSRSTAPTASPTTSAAASTTADDSSDARESTPPVLRRGSEGDEVTELELRLTQLGLYTRKASGHYNEGVEDAVSRYQWARGIQTAEHGVYDLATRERLESETQEP
ncbi:peptidoglycan-binding domain-containing protein [Streptomyces sp. NBC_00140]|uniref:peptidoglycan-binding domain-containing protein n=1 Tax=Streptomyces sp. NBC_00140 TaxID=2975664 RepID=UPI0022599B2F|nr:peptidoglycan-binding domain-containing protein [Streptomyces sp. NBC_00140]MCX5334475.1 peptidoglycan-binding protein [Streptomyces sp. NBC_00140]